MIEQEIVNEVIKQALEQNVFITVGMVTTLIIALQIIDYFKRKKTYTAEVKRDALLISMNDALHKAIDTLNIVSNYIGDLREADRSISKDKCKTIVRLALKKAEKDIFYYIRTRVQSKFSTDINEDVLAHVSSVFQQLAIDLSCFDFEGKRLDKYIKQEVWVERVSIDIVEIITANTVKDMDTMDKLNNIVSRLKSKFDQYINIIYRDIF